MRKLLAASVIAGAIVLSMPFAASAKITPNPGPTTYGVKPGKIRPMPGPTTYGAAHVIGSQRYI